MRLASGHEALVTRVLKDDGSTGFGFSLQLDATQARHMALYEAGLWPERPRITPVIAHPVGNRVGGARAGAVADRTGLLPPRVVALRLALRTGGNRWAT